MPKLTLFVLYALGSLIGAVGLVVIFLLRGAGALTLGLGMILAGAYILKNANIRRYAQRLVKKVTQRKTKGPGKVAWVMAFVFLISTLIFFGLAFEDLRTGHDRAWPIYAIAISGQIFVIILAHICGTYGRNLFK